MVETRGAAGRIAVTACLACALLAPALAAEGVRWPGASHALLIGTGDYDHWDDLANPLADVAAIAEELETGYGFEVETLEDPTKEEILLTLRSYHRRSFGPDDQLLILFAGHGYFDDLSRTGYLVARDTRLPEDDPTFESYLPYPTRLIDNIPAEHILLVADACFAGTLDPKIASHRGRDLYGDVPTAEYLARKLGFRTRRYLTSGGKEYVPDGRPGMNSPFARRLLEGLRSYGGADGVLSLAELFASYLDKADPQPRWNEFGSNDPGSGFFFIADRDLAGVQRPAMAGAHERRGGAGPAGSTVPAHRPPADAAVALRGVPREVSQQQLQTVVQHKNFRDSSWNPEGDFSNRFEPRTVGYDRVVVDHGSGLMWQAGGSPYRLPWSEVAGHVEEVNRRGHAGFSDWRLPTIEELASLIERSARNDSLFIDPVFDAEQEECWSADRKSGSEDRWHVRFTRGHIRSYSRGDGFYVRLVRSLDGDGPTTGNLAMTTD